MLTFEGELLRPWPAWAHQRDCPPQATVSNKRSSRWLPVHASPAGAMPALLVASATSAKGVRAGRDALCELSLPSALTAPASRWLSCMQGSPPFGHLCVSNGTFSFFNSCAALTPGQGVRGVCNGEGCLLGGNGV